MKTSRKLKNLTEAETRLINMREHVIRTLTEQNYNLRRIEGKPGYEQVEKELRADIHINKTAVGAANAKLFEVREEIELEHIALGNRR